ncbi:MAG TPA: helix-turn-helix transcriptional regulator [Blastocatellia bacterium]|nr:helix-turn-helix transcriptional regulator [Blastocatellia bacterium]
MQNSTRKSFQDWSKKFSSPLDRSSKKDVCLSAMNVQETYFDHEKLIEAREKRGLKAKDLCEATGLSKALLSHIEHGKTRPSADNLIRILIALDAEPLELSSEGMPERMKRVFQPKRRRKISVAQKVQPRRI